MKIYKSVKYLSEHARENYQSYKFYWWLTAVLFVQGTLMMMATAKDLENAKNIKPYPILLNINNELSELEAMSHSYRTVKLGNGSETSYIIVELPNGKKVEINNDNVVMINADVNNLKKVENTKTGKSPQFQKQLKKQ